MVKVSWREILRVSGWRDWFLSWMRFLEGYDGCWLAESYV